MPDAATYSLHPLPEGEPHAEHRRRLLADGRPLPVVVNGDAIAVQVACGRCTLLATSYDYFDGCSHWIYLLDEDGTPLDQVSMPDRLGFLRDHDLVSPHEVAFGFSETNDRWTVLVSERGFWSYAPGALIRRFNRFLLARRHLDVRRTSDLGKQP